MKPDIPLVYQYDYVKRLYRGDQPFEDAWRRVIGIGADFELIFNEYIDTITALIEHYSGYRWGEHSEPHIPVYLADTAESFAHPLTLSVHEEPDAMVQDLVYQLAHRNMYFGIGDPALRDKCNRSVARHVVAALQNRTHSATDQEFDLNEQTIKKVLNAPS